VQKLESLEAEIERAHKYQARSALLGAEQDEIRKPTKNFHDADYVMYRNGPEITIVDILNKTLVLQGDLREIDIYGKERKIMRDCFLDIRNVYLNIRKIATSAYLIELRYTRIRRSHQSSLFYYVNEAFIENVNDMETNRDFRIMPLSSDMADRSHEERWLYENMLLCIGNKKFTIAQFLIKGNLLVVDTRIESLDDRLNHRVWNRVCFNRNDMSVIETPVEWSVADYDLEWLTPKIVCTSNGVLFGDIDTNNVWESIGRQSSWDNQRKSCGVKHAKVYSYDGTKIFDYHQNMDTDVRIYGHPDEFFKLSNAGNVASFIKVG
jgi:hypothetical protein